MLGLSSSGRHLGRGGAPQGVAEDLGTWTRAESHGTFPRMKGPRRARSALLPGTSEW